MSQPETSATAQPGLTRDLAIWIAGFRSATPAARLWERHALLDWAAVTVAGAHEQLARMLAGEFGTIGGLEGAGDVRGLMRLLA